MAQAHYTADHLYEHCVQSAQFESIAVLTSIQRRVTTLTDLFIGKCDGDQDAPVSSLRESTAIGVDDFPRIVTKRCPEMYEYRRPAKGNLTVDGVVLHTDENFGQFVARVRKWKTEVLEPEMLKHDLVILFGHSLFFSLLMHLCTSLPSIESFDIECAEELSFHFPNCSISQMVYNGTRWSVLCQGDVAHLPSALRTGTHTSIYATPE